MDNQNEDNDKSKTIIYRKDSNGNIIKEVSYHPNSWLGNLAGFIIIVEVYLLIAYFGKIGAELIKKDIPVIGEKLYLIIPIGIFLFFLIAIYVSFIHRKLVKTSKNELKDNNNFALENQDLIEKSIESNYAYNKPLKKKILLSLLLFAIVTLLEILFIRDLFFSILISLLTSIPFLYFFNKYNDVNEKKYSEIVRKVLQNIDSELDYCPNWKVLLDIDSELDCCSNDVKFNKKEYLECLFPERCEFVDCEDTIVNLRSGFCFLDIVTGYITTSDDGGSTSHITFRGSIARENVKNVNCKILLGGTKKSFNKVGFVGIKFENDEFNKMFSAYSDNELLAYKILTPDVMEEFVNIKKNICYDIDVRIIYDKLYIRFLSGNTFESMAFSKQIEKSSLVKSISVLEKVMKAMDKAKAIIDKEE